MASLGFDVTTPPSIFNISPIAKKDVHFRNNLSSVYNFMVSAVWGGSAVENGSRTGITSTSDHQLIEQNLGITCPRTYSVY